MSYRLYIPGPLTVSDSIVQAMGKPMVGHRSGDFVKLYNDMQPVSYTHLTLPTILLV